MKTDILTPDERALFNDISMTTIALWKNNPMMWRWFWDVTSLHEYLLLNAMNTSHMWGACYIVASTTIH